MPKYRLADAYPPYVLQRYPELAIGMKCKTCGLEVLVGFNCHCSRGPTPDIGGVEFALPLHAAATRCGCLLHAAAAAARA